MAYGISNTTPAQSALNNKINPNPLNLSMVGSSNTVQPIGVNISAKTSGTTTSQGLSMNPISPTAGIVNPQKLPVATPQPYASSTIQNDSVTQKQGFTPQQMASQNTSGIGAGSIDPSLVIPTTQQMQQNTQQQPQQYSASNPPTYSGLVGQTANAGQNLIQNAQQDSPEVKAARAALQQSYQDEGQAIANIQGSPHTMNFAQGAENVIRNQYLANQGALSNTLNSAVTTQGQQFTAQNQGGGLVGTAAGLAAPQLGSIGQVPYSPLNGSQGSVLGSTQSGGVAQAGNLLGQFQGAQTAGAASGGIQAQQAQQKAAYQSAHQQAQNLQSQVTDLIKSFNLNPNDLSVANAGLQKIAQNTSNPQYQILSNYLADVASRYSQILTPAGGSSTDTTRAVATGMLNNIASGQSIIDVMNGLDQQAQAVIAGVQTTGNSGGSNTSSGGSSGANPWH